MADRSQINALDGMDDETAALLIQLHLADIEEQLVNIRSEGQPLEGNVSDAELSLLSLREELERTAAVISDRQMTRSTARAVIADGDAIATLREEDQDGDDNHSVYSYSTTGADGGYDDEFIDELGALYVETPVDASGVDNGEPSAQAAARRPNGIPQSECVICEDQLPFFEVATLSCNHEICRGCLQHMFLAAIKDESRYPPRCCDEIPVDDNEVALYLSSNTNIDIVTQYKNKKIEWDTKDRIYCSREDCALFIPSENIVDGVATCSTCGAGTCVICKEASHGGDCPMDGALQQTLGLLEQNGWRRCIECRAGVELESGCYHMTYVSITLQKFFANFHSCVCRAEFCYLCRAVWHTCQCPLWDERNIVLVSQIIINHQAQEVIC